MKKIALICVFISLISILSGSGGAALNKNSDSGKSKFLYLVAGFDDAAENTDVLFTVGVDTDSSTAYVAQIPRDTYFAFGESQNKINQIYAVKRLRGSNQSDAMKATTDAISSAFGVEFDGYIGVTVDSFKKIVDAIGGVDIEVPQDITLQIDGEMPLLLHRGVNHISGSDAEKFVRYRKGYATGDLGRIDAQKLFLNAIFAKFSSAISVNSIIDLASVIKTDVITNLGISDLFSVLLKTNRSKAEKRTFYATVPGEAAFSSNGLSYYVLNRKSAAETARKYMFSKGKFDIEEKFLNKDDSKFVDIYRSENIFVKEFSNKNLADIKI